MTQHMILTDYKRMQRSERVGAKFRNQATLIAQGIDVPAFICLSADLYDTVTQPLKPRLQALVQGASLQCRAGLASAAAAMQALVRGLAVDPGTAAAIERAMNAALPDAKWVSVRACMVGAAGEASEDSAADPFAGISETFLYVKRADVLARILDCWASAYSETALTYRLSQGMDPLTSSVAVGVQHMVFGERSFVMFTCDPNTAARDTTLIAGHGIGEGVVQEAVPVDHYFVEGKGLRVRSVIARKTHALSFDPERGEGLCRIEIGGSRVDTPCLRDDEVQALRALGQRIEKAFGWPQDIEGTIDAQGRISILQARPVSIDFTTKRIWTGLNVTESYPGISGALTYSLARHFYRVIFRDIYRRVGAREIVLSEHDHQLGRMIGYVNGRIHYSLNAFYLLHGLVPIFPWLSKAWEGMVGLKSSYFVHSGEPDVELGGWARRWNITRSWARFCVEYVKLPWRMREYRSWWEARAARSRAVLKDRQDPLALVEEFHRLWRDVGVQWGVTLINDAFIFTLHAIVEALFKRWRLEEDPELLSNLLCGDDQLESVEVFLSVLRITEFVRARPDLAASFAARTDAALVAELKTGTLDVDVSQRIARHIERYGDRTMADLKMESPSLRDDPTLLIQGIRRFLGSNLRAEDCQREEAAKRAQGEARLVERLGRRSLRRAGLRKALGWLREVIAHRENSRYCRSELFGISREIFHRLADHLVARGAVAQRDDVYHLHIDEVLGYVEGTGVDESFHAVVTARRQALEAYARAGVTPEVLVTNGALRANVLERAPPDPSRAASRLSGLGSSMGVARGRARVVVDPHQVGELAPDSILVARETDPGWLFLMLAASGIVVERGSMLSHTAITGRKFGIPTVVGVDDACSRIADGALLEIDGGSGAIELLS